MWRGPVSMGCDQDKARLWVGLSVARKAVEPAARKLETRVIL